MENMGIHRIGNVLLDTTQDRLRDRYDDGEVEEEFLQALRAGRAEEMLRKDHRWVVVYHLAPERQNILSWLPLTKEDAVLEIGCGCGAVTGALCRRAGHVDAVDISARRAEITALRNQEHGNLTVYAGNLNDLVLPRTYDVVTLIGVLEYAGTFTHTDDPFHDFLVQVRRFLKPGGRLVIAIENRLGLKYWSGGREDHYGRMFEGICNYPHYGKGSKIRTFSRQELARLLASAGLPEQQWFYPYPDYKFPMEIHSDRQLPRADEMMATAGRFPGTFDGNRYVFFPEEQAFAGVIEAGLYPEFANSFLVVCSPQPMDEEALPVYAHNPWQRKPQYRVGTAVYEQGGARHVVKYACSREARRHLANIEENGRILASLYGGELVTASHLVSPDDLWCEYAAGESFDTFCLRAVRERGVQGFFDCLNFFASYLVRGQETVCPTSLDFGAKDRRYDVDLMFDNVYLDGQHVKITDYEFLTARRCIAYALLHVIGVFQGQHKELWKELGLTWAFFLKEYQITEQEYHAFLEECTTYSQEVYDFHMGHYFRKRIMINQNL